MLRTAKATGRTHDRPVDTEDSPGASASASSRSIDSCWAAAGESAIMVPVWP